MRIEPRSVFEFNSQKTVVTFYKRRFGKGQNIFPFVRK